MATGRVGGGWMLRGGLSLTEREVRRESKGGGAGQRCIPADRGRDMTPVGEETDYKG